jgi:hypothetical protein
MIGRARSLRLLLILVSVAASACAAHRDPQSSRAQPSWTITGARGLCAPAFDEDVVAVCVPPVGWKRQPLVSVVDHRDQVWLSPTGDTAYGVIHFSMPLPVGLNIALAGFLTHMRQDKGAATLLERHDDPSLPGIRFVAEDRVYVIRAILLVEGWEGWAVYAGTLRNGPINQPELDFAVSAREHTRVGRSQGAVK